MSNTFYLHSQIQVLEFEPEKDTIRMAEVHSHPQEVWQISPCPSDPRMLMTVHNEGTTYHPPDIWPSTRHRASMQCIVLQGRLLEHGSFAVQLRQHSLATGACRGPAHSITLAHAAGEWCAGATGRAERELQRQNSFVAPISARCSAQCGGGQARALATGQRHSRGAVKMDLLVS